ncbi:MAG: Rrf2 family transcriptional regulator [Nitrospirae bacterium]|nr:Rrf2 family transcriptional regulator [Nitrospirota bacterium]
MRFSVKSEYAVTALLDMAIHADRGPIHVRSIASRQAIPVRFLEQVMASLKKAGIVESIRGAQGGYVLSRDAKSINVAQIVEAIEGPITPMDCTAEAAEYRCLQMKGCVVKEVWEDVKRAIIDVLNRATIEDMCKRKREREVTVMYHI